VSIVEAHTLGQMAAKPCLWSAVSIPNCVPLDDIHLWYAHGPGVKELIKLSLGGQAQLPDRLRFAWGELPSTVIIIRLSSDVSSVLPKVSAFLQNSDNSR
jgi:hypothetical protein